MDIILEIDYRENSILKLFLAENIKISDNIYSFENINYKICNLHIGDFVFKNNMNEILYIIERKTINDLCSSITDSRFREQKERLLESVNDSSKIIYIIEGNKNQISKFSKINKTTINSAIQNLILKHQYKVIFSDSLDDTLEQLQLLYKKIKENDILIKPSVGIIVKKSDKLNNNIFINQLTVIPGVSQNAGLKIHEIYKSMTHLINTLENNTNVIDKELFLSNIQVSEKRKIGKVLSKKIYSALI